MVTPFDLASLAIFALIAVVYLHRSAEQTADPTPIWVYAAAATACACGDVMANHSHPIAGAALIALSGAAAMWIVRSKRGGA